MMKSVIFASAIATAAAFAPSHVVSVCAGYYHGKSTALPSFFSRLSPLTHNILSLGTIHLDDTWCNVQGNSFPYRP